MENNKIFKEEVAIVTAAAEGIGFAIARQLVQRGAKLILNSRREETALEAAEKLNAEFPESTVAVSGDSSSMETIREIVSTAINKFGKISLVVANTGITTPGSFFDYSEEDYQQTIDVNLRGTYFLTQAAAKEMRKQGTGGSIVLMSSVNGEQANKELSAYAMTKAAIIMMAKSLVLELSPYNIRINSIAPGATMTERTQEDTQYEQAWSEVTPLRQVATPDDVAYATMFLLSPSSKHITGQNLTVDGGWTVTSPLPEGDTV